MDHKNVHTAFVHLSAKIALMLPIRKFFAPVPVPVLFYLFNNDFLVGGSQIIKDAISKPGDPQIQEEAWEKMLPLIKNLLDLKQSYSALNQVRQEN